MDTLWLVFFILIGACVGSFLNVVIYRLPRGQSIVFPASHCPACGREIRWHDNIPLVSWFLLGARCRWCKAPISPRYVMIEAATAIRVGGLFVCYYLLGVRREAGAFEDSWLMFLAHAGLLCGLLACAVIDTEHFIIIPEIMWVCAALGIVSAAVRPHPFWPGVSPTAVAAGLAGLAGLAAAAALVHWGFLQPSFLDAEEAPAVPGPGGKAARQRPGGRPGPGSALHRLATILVGTVSSTLLGQVPGEPDASESANDIPATAGHGVNPRREILREVAFLLPAFVLAGLAAGGLGLLPGASAAWAGLFDAARHPFLAPRLAAVGSALWGLLIGGLWIWGARIVFTLLFNKEAMGMGDVYILAAVGAVCGWIVPSLTFFVAPLLALGWAAYRWITRRQAVLAYGPWLAAGAMFVMIFYDPLTAWIRLLLAGPS